MSWGLLVGDSKVLPPGTRLNPEAFGIVVAILLTVPVHTTLKCICGRGMVDEHGLHALSCSGCGEWDARHCEVNNTI